MPSGAAKAAPNDGNIMANYPRECQNKLRMENGEWRIVRGGNKNAARMGGGGGCCTLLELFSSSGVLAIIAMGESFK